MSKNCKPPKSVYAQTLERLNFHSVQAAVDRLERTYRDQAVSSSSLDHLFSSLQLDLRACQKEGFAGFFAAVMVVRKYRQLLQENWELLYDEQSPAFMPAAWCSLKQAVPEIFA